MKVVKTNLLWMTAILVGTILFVVLIMQSWKSHHGDLKRLQSNTETGLIKDEYYAHLANLENPSKSTNGINNLAKQKEKVMLKWTEILRFAEKGNLRPDSVVTKSDAEWKKLLTPEQFNITRQKGTERAYSSEMCSLFEPGLYACVCCGTLLFNSEEKFESGTGWPSFTQPIKENVIAYHIDNSYGTQRVETICNICGAHLGHVFPDGPAPSGLRYCINALALKKIKK